MCVTLSCNGRERALVHRAHGRVLPQVTSVFDRNKDGKIDAEDAKVAFDEIIKVVGFNMPSGGGFSAGLLAGLKQG